MTLAAKLLVYPPSKMNTVNALVRFIELIIISYNFHFIGELSAGMSM